MVGMCQIRWPPSRFRPAQCAHTETSHLRAIGGDHRGAHHVSARTNWWELELGLPILLASRRFSHRSRAARTRVRRRSRVVSLLVAARHAAYTARIANPLQHLRRKFREGAYARPFN